MILKERAIRQAKKTMDKSEQAMEVETENDVAFNRDDANIEEEESYLADFGTMDIEEDDSIDIERSKSNDERMSNKRKRTI